MTRTLSFELGNMVLDFSISASRGKVDRFAEALAFHRSFILSVATANGKEARHTCVKIGEICVFGTTIHIFL